MKNFLNFFKKPNKINKVELLVKIVDYEIFDEVFMPLPGVPRVQPHWEYLSNKGTILIDLGEDIVDYLNNIPEYEFTFCDLFELRDKRSHLISVDLNSFKGFGIFYMFIDYTMDNKNYINFYDETSTINSLDFTRKNFKNQEYTNSRFYIQSIKRFNYDEDVTQFVKSLTNNPTLITPEIILLYSHHNIDLNDLMLKIVKVNLKK